MDTKFNNWRKSQYRDNTGFFPLFQNFNIILQDLSPGACKLYIFLGLHSNYKTGESFYSLTKISSELDCSPRTISNWMKELEEKNLVVRKQKSLNGVSTTYLLPY
ncbi:hypothetical protein C6P21_02700 [Weissella confusa]|uniref:helix-turn-helix domain-containing protein n=1 Tax=Weissella confusa TaxID=1583 RepID=UPI0010809578|nr:hypothetical protein C6P21_02700 [Weissella confusa]